MGWFNHQVLPKCLDNWRLERWWPGTFKDLELLHNLGIHTEWVQHNASPGTLYDEAGSGVFGVESGIYDIWLGCDIGGAKEPGVIYFPINWGAKEPQNLPNHRVVDDYQVTTIWHHPLKISNNQTSRGTYHTPKDWTSTIKHQQKTYQTPITLSITHQPDIKTLTTNLPIHLLTFPWFNHQISRPCDMRRALPSCPPGPWQLSPEPRPDAHLWTSEWWKSRGPPRGEAWSWGKPRGSCEKYKRKDIYLWYTFI